MTPASNGGDVSRMPTERRWGPSLGVCMDCDKLRKVQHYTITHTLGKWLCDRCRKARGL